MTADDVESRPSEAGSIRSSPSFGGAKGIGYVAGLMLMINNITGPGVPELPNLFVEAGWLFPLICTVFVCIASTIAASMYAEAMERIPGNEGFNGRIEYTTIVSHYFGKTWYKVSQIGLNGALQSLNIISVVQSAQVMDVAISAIFGRSCALNLTPFQNTWSDGKVSVPVAGSESFFSCVDLRHIHEGHPWGCHIVLPLGYLLTAAMAIPCGRWNLDDNMAVQVGAFWLTLACWLVWISACASTWDGSMTIPAVNTSPDTGSQAAVVGTILFNFGFVTTVPSWVNEKAPHVGVNRSLWTASTLCVVIFLAVGLPGALAFGGVLQGPVTNTCSQQVLDPSFNCANDLLQVLNQPATAPWSDSRAATFILLTSVYLFPIVAVVSSIPVFSIIIKYNIVENGFSDRFGFLWGVVAPWVIAFPLLYMPNALAQFVNFTSLVFVSVTDFIVPFLLYIYLQREDKARGGLVDDAPLALGLAGADGTTANSGALEVAEPSPRSSSSPPLGRRHSAFPCGCPRSPRARKFVAATLGTILAVLSVAAVVLTIQEGTYSFDAQACAQVGG